MLLNANVTTGILDPTLDKVVKGKLAARTAARRPPKRRLSGFATCGKCGGKLYATSRWNGTAIYRCIDCKLSIATEPVDIEVTTERWTTSVLARRSVTTWSTVRPSTPS